MTINEVEDLLRDGEWFRRTQRLITFFGGARSSPSLRGTPTCLKDGIARAQLRLRVLDALMSLGEPLRSIIALRVLERRSFAEIATLTSAPDEVIRVHQRRGLARVKATLRAQTGDNAEA